MSFIIIAALGKNNEIGKNNNIIWRIPEDMNFFKTKTTNNIIVMGKNTYESLPHALPNRINIVISKTLDKQENIIIYRNIEDVLNDFYNKETYIIGGESIYKYFLPYASKMYLTQINEECKDATVYFPKFDINEWDTKLLNSDLSYNEIKYNRIEYSRKLERTK